MSTPRDDDALSWDGDDDPTLDVGSDRPAPPAERGSAPRTPVPDAAPPARRPDSETAPASDVPDDDGAAPLGNAGLIGIGMIAATFLLFALGWFVAGMRLLGAGLPIPDVTVVALTIGAALSPPVWFVAVLALTRRARSWQRFLILVLGVLLLVPWPYLSTNGVLS